MTEAKEFAERSGFPSIAQVGPEAFQDRYSTEKGALNGHKQAVLAAEAGLIRREPDDE